LAELAHWTSGSQRVVRGTVFKGFGGDGSVTRNLKFTYYFNKNNNIL